MGPKLLLLSVLNVNLYSVTICNVSLIIIWSKHVEGIWRSQLLWRSRNEEGFNLGVFPPLNLNTSQLSSLSLYTRNVHSYVVCWNLIIPLGLKSRHYLAFGRYKKPCQGSAGHLFYHFWQIVPIILSHCYFCTVGLKKTHTCT